MSQKQNSEEKRKAHSPTLRTIRMVEDTLKNMDESAITVAGLKRILPKQVNHNTLMQVLEYLDQENRVYIGVRGITWIVNDSPKFRAAIAKGTRFEDLTKK